MSNERLHGFIISHCQDKRVGSIVANGKRYFFSESESKQYDFKRPTHGKPLAVTFTAWPTRKVGGDPLARDIQPDLDFFEERNRKYYGKRYHSPEARRAYKAATTSTDVPVAAE